MTMIAALLAALSLGLPGSARAAENLNLCPGKKMCALIYVAPWCPYCKKSAPTYRQYLFHANRYESFGLHVIVGAGKTARANNLTAQNYGSGALADNDHRVQNRYRIFLYPSYLILRDDGTVALRGEPARQWINQRYR